MTRAKLGSIRWSANGLRHHASDPEPIVAGAEREPASSRQSGARGTRVSRRRCACCRWRPRCAGSPRSLSPWSSDWESRCGCRKRGSPSRVLSFYGNGFIARAGAKREPGSTIDPRNADVLFPYLNGEDLNSRPDVIGHPGGSSTSMSVAKSEREAYAAAVRALVRNASSPSARRSNRASSTANDWWQFAEPRRRL